MSDGLFDFEDVRTNCVHCGRTLQEGECPWCDNRPVTIKDEPRKRYPNNHTGGQKQGAYDVAPRAGSQKARLLIAYFDAGDKGIVSSEACINAGISLAAGYRARVSELRDQNLIEPVTDAAGTVLLGEGALGSSQTVDRITADGVRAVRTIIGNS